MSNIHTPTDQVLSHCLDLGVLTTQASASCDTLGFTRAKLCAFATTAAASTFDAALQESNDNGVTDPWANVLGGAIATVPASSTKAIRLLSIDLTYRKRFLRVQETISGTVTGAIGIDLYNPDEAPVTQDFPATLV